VAIIVTARQGGLEELRFGAEPVCAQMRMEVLDGRREKAGVVLAGAG
jgi:hypothetical protein